MRVEKTKRERRQDRLQGKLANVDVQSPREVYLELEYLVTALVPSEIPCLESSPGRMRRTAVWISRDEMVDFLLYEASLEASDAIRSKMSCTNELRMAMALVEIPVSG